MMLDISVFCLDSESISNGTDILGVSHCGWQVLLLLASLYGAKVVVLVLCNHPEKELHLLSSLLFRSVACRLMLRFFGHLFLHLEDLLLHLRELGIFLKRILRGMLLVRLTLRGLQSSFFLDSSVNQLLIFCVQRTLRLAIPGKVGSSRCAGDFFP